MENRRISTAGVIFFGLIACLLYGLGAGIRSDIGILLNPLAAHAGIRYEDASFCVAVMEIVFGAVQPAFGLLARKTSNRVVLILGSLLLIVSMAGMMASRSFPALLFSLGFVFGAGAGALAFGLVLTSSIHFVGQENAMLIAGMLNAASGMVGFVLSPSLQSLLDFGGLRAAMIALGILSAVLIPVSCVVTSRDPKKVRGGAEAEGKSAEAPGTPAKAGAVEHGAGFLGTALRNPVYRLLLAGFTTCGFHMVLIETHLFSQFVSYGLAKNPASWAFSIYGIATIFGALLSGFLSTRIRKGGLLAFYYTFRAVWVLVYLFLLPKNLFTAILFATGLGLTGDATVSPTSGLVNEHFSLSQVATLVGLLFAVHQVGGFFSAWLGGVIVAATGSYQLLWIIDAVLCTLAGICSFRITRVKTA